MYMNPHCNLNLASNGVTAKVIYDDRCCAMVAYSIETLTLCLRRDGYHSK